MQILRTDFENPGHSKYTAVQEDSGRRPQVEIDSVNWLVRFELGAIVILSAMFIGWYDSVPRTIENRGAITDQTVNERVATESTHRDIAYRPSATKPRCVGTPAVGYCW